MTADAYSSILGWLDQGKGNNNNSWGDNCDTYIFPIFERAIAGSASHVVTGGTLDLSTSPPPAGATAALDMIHLFSGTLTSNQIVQVPNLPKVWIVKNGTSGNYTLSFKTPSGSSTSLLQGAWYVVWCDGADHIYASLPSDLISRQWAGIDGTISLPGLSFSSETSLGIRRVSAGVLAITSGGVDIVTLSASGLDVGSGLALSIGGASVVPPGTEVTTAALSAPTGWYFEYGQAVARAGDAPLLNAITKSFTANTNGTNTLTGVSEDLRHLGLEGSVIEGTGIFTGATIVSVDSATQITMSAAATTTATGVAVRAFPFGNGDGVSTFNIPDARGTTAIGRDDMGGTAANRVTFAGSGVAAYKLCVIGGAETHTLDDSEIPTHHFTGNTDAEDAHTHPYKDRYWAESSLPAATYKEAMPTAFNARYGSAATDADNSYWLYYNTETSAGESHFHPYTTDDYGGGGAHNNVQPSRIRNVMIKR